LRSRIRVPVVQFHLAIIALTERIVPGWHAGSGPAALSTPKSVPGFQNGMANCN
jgi:hypothetical protein